VSALTVATLQDAKCIPTTGTLKVQVEFPIFAITVMNFLGWILFMVFLPLG
jgi:membrane-associated HD superfamily phosphohydrolase